MDVSWEWVKVREVDQKRGGSVDVDNVVLRCPVSLWKLRPSIRAHMQIAVPPSGAKRWEVYIYRPGWKDMEVNER